MSYFRRDRCDLCGRFMSYVDLAEAVMWTPYGGYLDLEPPDEEYAHRHCWDEATEETRVLIRYTAWRKPNEHQAAEVAP